ncbi:hypothetical protein cypCar_00006328 [Cyprinus carpio]|nr:hypothetical protein cypCar_00006328 [Cyprinus carpio]
MIELPALSVTWTLVLLVLTLLYIYGVWPHGFFKKLGIPGPRPWPFFGTFLSYTKGFFNFDMECAKKYGKVWGIYDGRLPILMVTDLEMIKVIMVKECYSTFTNRRIFPIAVTHADRFIKNMQKKDHAPPVKVKEVVAPYSLDVVTSSSFSVDIDSINNADDPFATNIKKFLKFSLFSPLFLILALFPSIANLLGKMGISLFSRSSMEFFYNVLKKIKDEHNKESNGRVDFLQLMLQNQIPGDHFGDTDEQPAKGLTDHEILSQSFIFILGGYETTSTTLTFLLYNLATNPDCLEKLVKEIDTNFPPDTPITYDALMKMDYLEMAINESMRLLPTAPRLERVCKKTVELNGVTIPKDTLVAIPTYVLYRDPQLWDSPDEFRPERFSPESKSEINQYIFMPFGLGPRNCIGMRFAQMIMKLLVVKLLQNFSMETCKETQGLCNFDMECAKKYGKVWGIYDGRLPILMVTDLEMIKVIMVKECYSNFINRRKRTTGLAGPFADGIIMVQDERWKRMRSTLSPYFTSGRLKEIFPIAVTHADRFIKNMQKKDHEQPVKVKEVVGPYSLDVVTSSSFSVDIDSINKADDPFVTNVKKFIQFNMFNPLFLLIRLTDHEILSQSLVFILGGYETTSTTLTFLLYNLATNPDCLEKLVEEIDTNFPPDTPITYDALMKMDYLEMAINESMRLLPTAPRLERSSKKTVEINGVTIPKDTLVGIPTYVLCRDPQLWESPDEFRPERFSPESKSVINQYAFLPFGLGPRNCIGMRFALMIMKILVVKLLQNFSVETCKETQIPLEMNAAFQPKVPITLKFIPRSHKAKQ